MSILDLKSNLSNFRKPSTVKDQEKLKLKEALSIKPVYSTSNELKNTLDIKINKVDNSTSIQVPGAKKIDYKLFSINTSRRRGVPAISTLFGKAILDKESLFKKITPGNIVKVSEYKTQRPVSIPKESNFVKITPVSIQHISTFNAILTILKNKVSLYKEQFPRALPKISQYIDQSPRALLKLSLYIDQIPRVLSKLSLYKDQRPNILDKLSLYKKLAANGFDDLQSGARGFTLYQTITQYLGLDTGALTYTYPKTVKFGRLNDRLSFTGRGLKGFDDLTSGAIGFTAYQAVTQYLGVNTIAGTYTYPNTVKLGDILNKSTFYSNSKQGFLVDDTYIQFDNVLANTKLKRIYNTDKTPYTNKSRQLTNISNSLKTYAETRRSPSPLDIEYTKFNLRTASYNPFSFGPAFNQPLILRGIQREKIGDLAQEPQSWGFKNNFDDGLIRGGTVGSTERAIFDTIRIGKWMASPRGLLFIVKQAGLQASAPITEADPFVGARAGNGALTLISSLANTATQHLGIRFRKDAVPFIPRTTYSGVMFGIAGIDPSSGVGIRKVNQPLILNRLYKLKETVLNLGSTIISTGLGGPQSVYGIGSTTIRRTLVSNEYTTISNTGVVVIYKPSSEVFKYITNKPYIDYNTKLQIKADNSVYKGDNLSITAGDSQQYYSLTYDNIRTRAKESNLNSTEIINFLLTDDAKKVKWIPTKGDFQDTVIQNYTQTSQHIRKKLKVPDYGRRGKDLQNPQPTMPDSDNFQYTYQGLGSVGMTDPIWQINQTDKEAVDDFIKFMFHDLNTNERFRFRAYIENVSEDFSPEWQEVKILGRADSAYIYQGFSRNLSISFKAAALSRGDLMLMWDQLERLAKTTLPEYNSTYKMKGPLIKFTLGNWFINTPAFIKSLSYTVDNDTPWEINLSNSGVYGGSLNSNSVGELPMTVSVQVSMQIFGEVRPESTSNNSDKISKPAGITESNHYNKGNLYPLGNEGLRGRRQFANYNVQTEG
jgi:hypothetical protein